MKISTKIILLSVIIIFIATLTFAIYFDIRGNSESDVNTEHTDCIEHTEEILIPTVENASEPTDETEVDDELDMQNDEVYDSDSNVNTNTNDNTENSNGNSNEDSNINNDADEDVGNETDNDINDDERENDDADNSADDNTINADKSTVDLGRFKLTAYCNCSKCCGIWAGGATASGAMPVAGHTIAVDKSVIPMGSKVIINGHTYVAQDTGSSIIGNRIDIYFDTHQEALNFGVQYANVYLANN